MMSNIPYRVFLIGMGMIEDDRASETLQVSAKLGKANKISGELRQSMFQKGEVFELNGFECTERSNREPGADDTMCHKAGPLAHSCSGNSNPPGI